MMIQLKKGRDGKSTLACVREDGSRTWARVHPFFPVHDLTHCAVESVFGFTQAFFGLIASGREIDETEHDLSAEAIWAEHIVGILDRERASGVIAPASELTYWLNDALRRSGGPEFRGLEEDELAAARLLRDSLAERWYAVPPGETLEVRFPVPR
jgi:hypothetical protein